MDLLDIFLGWIRHLCKMPTPNHIHHRAGRKSPSIVDTYNGAIPELRLQGHSLQDIADRCGVTREAVRQALKKHYPESLYPSPGLLSTSQLALELGVSLQRMRNLAKKINISPALIISREKQGYILWHKDVIPLLKVALKIRPKCRICDKPVPVSTCNRVYCSNECYLESRKYKYRSLEYKKRHHVLVAMWQKEHKEVYKKMQVRATAKYHAKIMACRRYAVIRRCAVPKGEIVANAGGMKDKKLPVSWQGDIYCVPVCCLKIVRE